MASVEQVNRHGRGTKTRTSFGHRNGFLWSLTYARREFSRLDIMQTFPRLDQTALQAFLTLLNLYYS